MENKMVQKIAEYSDLCRKTVLLIPNCTEVNSIEAKQNRPPKYDAILSLKTLLQCF